MTDASRLDLIQAAIEDSNYFVSDKLHLPGRHARLAPVPNRLRPQIRETISKRFPGGLYQHQADALNAILDNQDVCLATSTASGKSLVFIAGTLDLLLKDSSSTVLALYPARALIQDQIEKWRELMDPLTIPLGYIDGSVPMDVRTRILKSSRVVLMTPDVAHAWMMSHLGEGAVQRFLRSIKIIVLDEAHVYDGVFGTNMAYFLRRLAKAAQNPQILCSTATVGEPDKFVVDLTGRRMCVFGPQDDASSCSEKTILLCRSGIGGSFENAVLLLNRLSKFKGCRFLAFGDSRKMVEQMVAVSRRFRDSVDSADSEERDYFENDAVEIDDSTMPNPSRRDRMLPYRAGYEASDRRNIQRALSEGQLSGVISTSALELGLDIGEIDIVVLLNAPPTVKSFFQRLGRAGRRRAAVCIVLDDQNRIRALRDYLARPMEPGWLYLDNRYIQYANVLCTATELASLGQTSTTDLAFESLPPAFSDLLKKALDPRETIPNDLYPRRQRGAKDPHCEFPIRSAMEKEFKVSDIRGIGMGRLTLPQAMREGYPGAVYYYMGRAYRVLRLNYRAGEIFVQPTKQWATSPLTQSMIFPRLQGGVLSLWKAGDGFLAEVEVQVSERVSGFIEHRGNMTIRHEYGRHSEYCTSPLNRFFCSTGICWDFPVRVLLSEVSVRAVRDAFCRIFGVQERDLGIGPFFSRAHPFQSGSCRGWCIYDATNGSLRLTQRLAQHFSDVLQAAIVICDRAGEADAARELTALVDVVSRLTIAVETPSQPHTDSGKDLIEVIAPGEKAFYINGEGPREVEVVQFRHTPHGPMYELKSPGGSGCWMVSANSIQPLHGSTRFAHVDSIS